MALEILARAMCSSCAYGFLVAFLCKGTSFAHPCTGRQMFETAAHLADHAMPPIPVRQKVISLPKRLRRILAQRSQAVITLSLISMEEIERLICNAAGLPDRCNTQAGARLQLNAVSFQYHFGSAINRHDHQCVSS